MFLVEKIEDNFGSKSVWCPILFKIVNEVLKNDFSPKLNNKVSGTLQM